MSTLHDVLIVGAGPAGSTLAYSLAKAGLDVLLIDKAAFPRDKTCGDALTPRALHVIQNLGLLDDLKTSGYQINHVKLVAPNGDAVFTEVPPYRDWPACLLVVPRLTLDDKLLRYALAAGAEFRPHVDAREVVFEHGQAVGVKANTPEGPAELRARVVVIATGAATGLVERAGLMRQPMVAGRAARGYYEGVRGLSDTIEFHFAAPLLPGYGWVFPISKTAANIGAGYYGYPNRPPVRSSPRLALDDFLASPPVAALLGDAQPIGPARGYPFRTDFDRTQPAHPGLLLVGEAAGLVNPLTGEGIDYAVESAQVAAEVVLRVGPRKEARALAAAYAQALRRRFLFSFVGALRIRDLYIRPLLLNKSVRAAKRYESLKVKMFHAITGSTSPSEAFSLKTFVQVALA